MLRRKWSRENWSSHRTVRPAKHSRTAPPPDGRNGLRVCHPVVASAGASKRYAVGGCIRLRGSPMVIDVRFAIGHVGVFGATKDRCPACERHDQHQDNKEDEKKSE